MITLQKNKSRVIINPDIGASIVELVLDDNTISREVNFDSKDPLQLSGLPMFPFCNRIKNGKFSFFQNEIYLKKNYGSIEHPLHGHGWLNQWQIIFSEMSKVTLGYSHASSDWPWDYHSEIDYILFDKLLYIEIRLTNNSQSPMPFGMGFHPYFKRTKETKIKTIVSGVWQTDKECLPTYLAPPNNDLFDQEDNTYIGFKGCLKINYPNMKVNLEASKNCVNLHIYAPKGENFFCAEPATHTPDSFNREITGSQILLPNKTAKIWNKISIIDL